MFISHPKTLDVLISVNQYYLVNLNPLRNTGNKPNDSDLFLPSNEKKDI